MSQIAILTDSTAYLTADLIDRYQIRVIPLKIHWKGETYLDGVNLTPNEFYPRLKSETEIPTTSQPGTQEFIALFEELGRDCTGIILPLISSGISGTVDNARIAAEMFTAHNPAGRSAPVPIKIIDTKTTSGGLGLVTLAIARAIEAGYNLDEVAEIAQETCRGLSLFSMVDTLEYLHRGGRIGGAARYFGSALQIKPILYFNEEGKLDALERVRTRQKALNRVVELAVNQVGKAPVRAAVFHSYAPESAEIVREAAEKQLNCVELLTFELSPVIGIHVGPGIAGITLHIDRG